MFLYHSLMLHLLCVQELSRLWDQSDLSDFYPSTSPIGVSFFCLITLWTTLKSNSCKFAVCLFLLRPLLTRAPSECWLLLTNTSCSLVFLPRLSIITWWWRQQPLLQPQTTTSCLTASCRTPLHPLPPNCSSTNQEPRQQPLRLPRWPTGRATRAVAAWSHPAASVTHTLHTRAHTPHTHTPGWWPAGAALKQQWQLFTAGYRTWYHWTDCKRVTKTLRVQLQSINEHSHKLFGYRVKFWSSDWLQVVKLIWVELTRKPQEVSYRPEGFLH